MSNDNANPKPPGADVPMRDSRYHSLELTGGSIAHWPASGQVKLDGHPISVQHVTINAGVGQLPEVTLSLSLADAISVLLKEADVTFSDSTAELVRFKDDPTRGYLRLFNPKTRVYGRSLRVVIREAEPGDTLASSC